MNDSHLMQIFDGICDCSKDVPEFYFGERLFFEPAFFDDLNCAEKYFGEVSFSCIFHDDVDVIHREKRIIVFDDIGMLYHFECFDLSKGLYLLFLLYYSKCT